jgi:hypothetical protein
VGANTAPEPAHVAVDNALRTWRQGDCVLGEHWFVHRVEPSLGLTAAARAAIDAGVDLAESLVTGLVVVTQTCDIVRSCRERPYVEVCPLVKVAKAKMLEIERGRRPALAFLPLLRQRRLVADLDRVMTVEKAVVANWTRVPGWQSDEGARNFALALARKRARFAFPTDFGLFVRKLRERLEDKHGKNSDEGRALRALGEIRVQASPSWDDTRVFLMFWFIRHDHDVDFEGKNWAELLVAWLKLVPAGGRFTNVQGQVTTLDRFTASDYVFSDRLDLDHLSSGVTQDQPT